MSNASDLELFRISALCYPPGAVLAQLILLRGDIQANLPASVDSLTDTITSNNHGFVTGSRVRINSSGTAPGGTATGVDYYAIVLTPNTYQLAQTVALAIANTPINLTDSGTGNVVINEQALVAGDPLTVLLNKELPNINGYARSPLTLAAAAVYGDGVASNASPVTITNSSSSIDLVFRHMLWATGASSTIGDASGITGHYLESIGSDEVILPLQGRQFDISVGLSRT